LELSVLRSAIIRLFKAMQKFRNSSSAFVLFPVFSADSIDLLRRRISETISERFVFCLSFEMSSRDSPTSPNVSMSVRLRIA
jgi:hypothetical protein